MIALAQDEPRVATGATAPRVEAPAAGNIVCVGISHRTAPVALRERLALSDEAIRDMLSRYRCGDAVASGAVSELVVLSTCNRLELYASGGRGAPDALLGLIAERTDVRTDVLRASSYRLVGIDAVRHLCVTAAGLDSMIIGEPQILGQITTAFEAATAQQSAGHALSTLFRGATRAGRRARAETGINREPVSVSSVAAKLVADAIGDIAAARVLILGAGEMAQLAALTLHRRGVRSMAVASRTMDHARQLAERVGARTAAWADLLHELHCADVVIAATGAPCQIMTQNMVLAATSTPDPHPLAIVDMAVPRNVDPGVRDLPGVSYWDLDDLQQRVGASQAYREAQVADAERVALEEAERCIAELRRLDVQPLIADLRAQLETVRRGTLEKALRGLSDLSTQQRMRIENFSESLVNQLFHEAMTRLRDEAAHGQAAGYAMAMRHLFGLDR